jgi:uncharacterized protein
MPNEPGTMAHTFSRMMFRGMDKMRHRDAFGIGPATGTGFAGLENYRQIVLVTFKRSGEAMPSPINHGIADGKLYVRTDASTGKVKRIRNNPNVLVVASNLRGKPTGPVVAGVARILPDAEHANADEVIAANWSAPMKVFERSLDLSSQTLGIPMAFIEIMPSVTTRGG